MTQPATITPRDPRATAPAVQVDDLTKHYGDVRALDGISFAIGPGEAFGLLGHNGAGKSTTIRILTGRARPTGGRATVLGHLVPDELAQVRAHINLVPETPTVYERATAKENLELFCRLYRLPTARALQALERVRLDGAAGRKVKTFSTGMRQRLLLARACSTALACCSSTSRRGASIPSRPATCTGSSRGWRPAAAPCCSRPTT